MNNKKIRSTQWAILPILFCSAAVLAGDGGLEAPYGQLPPAAPQPTVSLDYEQPPVGTCDSGNPARGVCPTVAAADVPDSMSQAQDLGAESDGFIDDATQTSSINTGYVGGRTRLGVGIDSEFKGKADLSHVFSEDENSAIIGQGYVGVNPKADSDKNEETLTGAGAKLNYHWGSKGEDGQVSHVNKVFGAYDQNEQKDKKVTVGYGQERESLFWSGHVSKGLSDKRDTGAKDNSGNTIFEKAYDWGLGGRVGTYLADQQMRVQGGLDYEWGKDHAANEDKAKQVTLTGGVEKFFPDSPHSVNANLDVYKKSGGYEEGDSKAEVRGGVGYRYDIASEAGIWQADKMYRRVRTEIPGEAVQQPPKIERKLVKHTMELEADTFFKVDSAKLTPEAQTRMSSVIAQMRECGPEGNIRISGNTCDVGSTQHNQKLSERRANSVRDFLVKNGFPANTLLAEGLGESSPKYPNTEAERHKNRRVDVEYVCYQNEYKDQVVEQGGTTRTDPKVVWKQELIPTPPLWVRQALHNTADHKQRVDTYKTTAGGACTLSADDDSYTVAKDSGTTPLNVLDGDTGCGKTLNISDVGSATNGTVVVSPDGQYLSYTPNAGFSGEDSFTYTITDDEGNTDTATVTITVGNAPPKAEDDARTTNVDTLVNVNVLANDSDPEGDTLTIQAFTQGSHGTVVQNGSTLDYTPASGFTGPDTFTYTINDSEGNTSTATVTITVNPGACSLSADNDDYNVAVDSGVTQLNVLDGDERCGTATITAVGSASGGTVTISSDGLYLNYEPNAGFTGNDSFTYTITDSNGGTSTGTVNITVGACTASCTTPTLVNDDRTTDNVTPVTIDVLANDSDQDGDTLSIQSFTQGSNGTVEQVSGQLKYTPNSGYVGTDTFTYTVSDGHGHTATATVTVTVSDATGGSCPANLAASDTVTFAYTNSPSPIAITPASYVGAGDVIESVYITDSKASSETVRIEDISNGGMTGTVVRDGNSLTFYPSAGYCPDGEFTFYIKVAGCDELVAVTIALNQQ